MRNQPLRFSHDAEADAAYVVLSDAAVARTLEIGEGILIDLDALDRPVGVEVTAVRARLGEGDLASYLHGLIEGLLVSRREAAA